MRGIRMLHTNLSNVAGSRCPQGLSQVLRFHRVVGYGVNGSRKSHWGYGDVGHKLLVRLGW